MFENRTINHRHYLITSFAFYSTFFCFSKRKWQRKRATSCAELTVSLASLRPEKAVVVPRKTLLSRAVLLGNRRSATITGRCLPLFRRDHRPSGETKESEEKRILRNKSTFNQLRKKTETPYMTPRIAFQHCP